MAKAKAKATLTMIVAPTPQQQRLEDLSAALTPEAVEWIDELKNYRKYTGADARYSDKARMGILVIGHAVRLHATLENARSNDLVSTRLFGVDGNVKPKQIASGK